MLQLLSLNSVVLFKPQKVDSRSFAIFVTIVARVRSSVVVITGNVEKFLLMHKDYSFVCKVASGKIFSASFAYRHLIDLVVYRAVSAQCLSFLLGLII